MLCCCESKSNMFFQLLTDSEDLIQGGRKGAQTLVLRSEHDMNKIDMSGLVVEFEYNNSIMYEGARSSTGLCVMRHIFLQAITLFAA